MISLLVISVTDYSDLNQSDIKSMTFRQGPANLSTIREENHPDWDGKTRKNPFQEMWSANESFILKTQMSSSSIFDKVTQQGSEY